MPTTLGSTTITFGDSTTQSSAAGGLAASGTTVNAPSRATGTTYTNSTGRTIWVSVSCPGAGTGNFYVNGILAQYSLQDAYPRVTMGVVVPRGATYSYSGPGFNYWREIY